MTVENERKQLRTSLYLVLRAEALLGALKFFAKTSPDASRRRVQFLAQSDFWEWEIDNLIYSFTNLAERQKSWQSSHDALAKLATLGVAVNVRLLKRVRHGSDWKLNRKGTRVAPVELLKEVIEIWNGLIDAAETEFIKPMLRNIERFNVQSRKDLSSLRREMPSVEITDDEAE